MLRRIRNFFKALNSCHGSFQKRYNFNEFVANLSTTDKGVFFWFLELVYIFFKARRSLLFPGLPSSFWQPPSNPKNKLASVFTQQSNSNHHLMEQPTTRITNFFWDDVTTPPTSCEDKSQTLKLGYWTVLPWAKWKPILKSLFSFFLKPNKMLQTLGQSLKFWKMTVLPAISLEDATPLPPYMKKYSSLWHGGTSLSLELKVLL